MRDQGCGRFDGSAKFLLLGMSFLYGRIVRLTRFLYAARLLPVFQAQKPVISIGNLTVGGTGKTPLVLTIVRLLIARGLKVAILTRGYMPQSKQVFSDEARMIEESLPGVAVFASPNRRLSIQECLKHHAADVFVCDDAFQHWPLHRDLDIVAVDAVNPFGNGHLLPRGILREEIEAIRRAQVIVLTKTNQPLGRTQALRSRLAALHPDALIVESRHAGRGCVDVFEKIFQDIAHVQGLTAAAFCAIADPQSFRQSLQECGVVVDGFFTFSDHHVFTVEDLAPIRRYAKDRQIRIILTTHKDAVKIQNFREFWQGYRVYYLDLELEITQGKNVFIERLLSAMRH